MAFAERPGEPLMCRICGDSRWVAEYFLTVREDVLLVRTVDDRLHVDDWLGETHSDADARTDEECYRCLECDEELPAEREGNNHPRLLLLGVTDILNRGDWNLETLAAIADMLRQAGFDIPEPDEDDVE